MIKSRFPLFVAEDDDPIGYVLAEDRGDRAPSGVSVHEYSDEFRWLLQAVDELALMAGGDDVPVVTRARQGLEALRDAAGTDAGLMLAELTRAFRKGFEAGRASAVADLDPSRSAPLSPEEQAYRYGTGRLDVVAGVEGTAARLVGLGGGDDRG